jgi:hypothetical protein
MESAGNQHLLAQQAIGHPVSASVARKDLQVVGPLDDAPSPPFWQQ